MIIQLSPPIPLNSPKGPCLAHFLIDYGIEMDNYWICFQDNTGECWTWRNRDILAQKNITQGRDYISTFYNADNVKLNRENYILHLTCAKCEKVDLVPKNKAENWICECEYYE
jgi:hypothetical protein